MNRFKFSNGYANFVWRDKDLVEKFGLFGKGGPVRLATEWAAPAPLMELDGESASRPLADWQFMLANIPIISERAADALRDFWDGCAEVLPLRLLVPDGNAYSLTVSETKLYALNVFRINALDLKESRFTMWPSSPGRLWKVTKVVFCADIHAHLFSLRGFPGMYCSDEFRARAEDAQLTGVLCTKELEFG